MEHPGINTGVLVSPTQFSAINSRNSWLVWNSENEDIPTRSLAEVYDVCAPDGTAGRSVYKIRKPTKSGLVNVVVIPYGIKALSLGKGTTDDQPDGLQVAYFPGDPVDTVNNPVVGDLLGCKKNSWMALRGQPFGFLRVMSVDNQDPTEDSEGNTDFPQGKTAICRIVEAGPQLYELTSGPVGDTIKGRMYTYDGTVAGPEVDFFFASGATDAVGDQGIPVRVAEGQIVLFKGGGGGTVINVVQAIEAAGTGVDAGTIGVKTIVLKADLTASPNFEQTGDRRVVGFFSL